MSRPPAPPERRRIVAVIGPGEGATDQDVADAAAAGAALAGAGWVVLTGGRHVGVMDAASRGAHDAGGLVVAVLPGATDADATPFAGLVLRTGLGEARDAVVATAADAVVVCGMSAGTAAELGLAVRVGRPVVLVRPSLATTELARTIGGTVRIVPTADGVASAVEELLAPRAPQGAPNLARDRRLGADERTDA